MVYDIAVVGGGAAGLFAAIQAKRLNKHLNIVVLEALERVGKKLITTGNGQCNITNKNASRSFYNSENPEFIDRALSLFTVNDTVEAFSQMGVEIVFEQDGRAYPASYQAGSVVDAMRFTVSELGIEVVNSAKINSFTKDKEFILESESGKFLARRVIFACGMLSGGAKLGSFGDAFRMFRELGYKCVKSTPSLVQLKTETDVVKQLKGIKFDGKATLRINGKDIKKYSGEILFTDYGLSGPAILGVSREASRNNGKIEVSLDIMPETDLEDLLKKLYKRKSYLICRQGQEFLTGLINKRLGQVLLKTAGIPLNLAVGNITDKQIKKLAILIKNFVFYVTGTTGFNNSQVTAGGISLTEINIDTFESKRHSGLYIIGEMLDVDGECGGYNLQWAWSSAAIAAKSAVLELQ